MKPARALTLAALVPAALVACAPAEFAEPRTDPAAYRPAEAPVTVPGIGGVGRWMITKDLVPATWLGERHGGRTLREPINVLLVDRAARSPGEATRRLLAAMVAAGYGPRGGHSDGYFGEIGGLLLPMLPTGRGEAFSDGPAALPNNHGRVFGPVSVGGGYAFTGAFSLEGVRLLPRPRHTYRSFVAAREDLADKLSARTEFRRAGYVEMGSRLDTPGETAGDHDGRAVLLVAGR